MKLLSYLQQTIQLSRRWFTTLVDQGKILCNNQKVESYWFLVQEGDIIDMDQKRLVVKQKVQKNQLIAFYKPAGCVVSKADPHNDTVYRHLPAQFSSFYYIWRLDKESRGLLLMTNDPKLVDEYEHPSHGMKKSYLVILDKPLRDEQIEACLKGVEDDWDTLSMYSVASARFSECPESYFPHDIDGFLFKVVLESGKKRHIRRMFRALGYRVRDLLRIQEWTHELWSLEEWQWKEII